MNINEQLREISDRATHNRISKKINDLERQSGLFGIAMVLFFIVLGLAYVVYVLGLFGVI